MEPASLNSRVAGWYTSWRKPIRNWLRNRASVPASDIDDLTQEVYARLLLYKNDESTFDNPHGYIFRIASNVASEWRDRARIRHPHNSEWLDELIDFEDGIEERVLNGYQSRAVSAAVNRLPPRQRTAILLHVCQELTYKQIADQQGLTYRTVLRDLTRAYTRLRKELRGEL